MEMNTNHSRRTFIKLFAATSATLALSRGQKVRSEGGTLPIPTLDTGTLVNGVRVFNLTMDRGTKQLLATGAATAIWGYNNSILGPTIQLHKGEDVQINVTNNLGVPSTTHWHGLHIPASMDGGPHQIIAPGETWSPAFTMSNRASTCWYHPHLKGLTGEQVYRGLSGLLYVTDDAGNALTIPKTYGVDDIPLIVQDRKFHNDNSLDERGVVRKGNRIMVNGEIEPILNTHAQMIRFRLHNASNARLYNFGFSDNRTFSCVASEGGFLTEPASMNRLFLTPGERAEIVVDFSSDLNKSVNLLSYSSEIPAGALGNVADPLDRSNFTVLAINIGPETTTPIPVTALPGSLVSIARLAETEAVNFANPRLFSLQNGQQINGLQMNINRIDQVVTLDTIEIWEISNLSGLGHPFHIHDDTFQILTRNGDTPPAHELGWKDTVFVAPGETVRVIRPFVDFSDSEVPYMFHCHLLEHEDEGMMGQFTVVADNKLFLPIVLNP